MTKLDSAHCFTAANVTYIGDLTATFTLEVAGNHGLTTTISSDVGSLAAIWAHKFCHVITSRI
jgi:hypothetical protein